MSFESGCFVPLKNSRPEKIEKKVSSLSLEQPFLDHLAATNVPGFSETFFSAENFLSKVSRRMLDLIEKGLLGLGEKFGI